MTKHGYVYALRHNATKKIYIGQTHNLEGRIEAHLSKLKSGCHDVPEMQNDYNTHGFDYTVYILAEGDFCGKSLLATEKAFMALYNTTDPDFGYNYRETAKNFDIEKCKMAHLPLFKAKNVIKNLADNDNHNINPCDKLTDKEKELVENISKLPVDFQDRFLYQAQGVVLTLDALREGELF